MSALWPACLYVLLDWRGVRLGFIRSMIVKTCTYMAKVERVTGHRALSSGNWQHFVTLFSCSVAPPQQRTILGRFIYLRHWWRAARWTPCLVRRQRGLRHGRDGRRTDPFVRQCPAYQGRKRRGPLEIPFFVFFQRSLQRRGGLCEEPESE